MDEANTPPSSWYIRNEFYQEVERAVTFKSNWLIAGRINQIPNDGDYIAKTILDEPILLMKGKYNQVNAFYNVCRHHAAKLYDDGVGNIGQQKVITCPYHGWQYNAEGNLIKAVNIKGCKNFRPKHFGLKPILVDIVGPWIYINLGDSPTGSLLKDKVELNHMFNYLQATRYEELVHIKSQSYHMKCNWKVFIDNYLDGGYHVPIAHPRLSDSLNLDTYKRQRYNHFFLQSCEAKQDTESNSEQIDKKPNRLVTESSSSSDGRVAYYLFQYPNICINRYGKWLDTNIVWPINEKECIVEFEWFIHPSELNDNQLPESVLEDLKQSDEVQQEDISLCQRVQSGLISSGYEIGRYAPMFEEGEFMFHQKLYQDYQSSTLVNHPT